MGENGEEVMAITLKKTGSVSLESVKACVYGQAGAGKTKLIETLPDPLIISSEAGLLSIQDADIPYIAVKSMEDMKEAYQFIMSSDEAKQFQSISLDSISEIGEVVLNQELKNAKDPRQAYGVMQQEVSDLIRAFRDIPNMHVYFSAKMEKQQDEMGRILYQPSMPGNKMGQSLPYFFDLLLALRMEKDAEGVTQRALMCDSDGLWQAKDRSGKLDMWEAPDLGAIISKIKGES